MTTYAQSHSFFYKLLIDSSRKMRFIRHALLWVTALLLIYQGFYFIADTIPEYTSRNAIRYSLLSTSLFGGLTIVAYWIITILTRQFILLRFRIDLFLVALFGIHIITAEVVLAHFGAFIQLLSLNRLPRLYRNSADHVAQLAFWQAPFDPTIVWLFSFSLFYNYLLYAVGLKIFKDFFTIQFRKTELEKENLRLEFDFLKAQVNPHFLFNTLNNIYSFAVRAPDQVADPILKLADLMRYTLYETSEEWVNLTKEVAFLRSYIDLQRIRHDDHVTIQFRVIGQPATQLIPPLLLITFVENAFKHGVEVSAKASWVDICLLVGSNSLTLQVYNSIPSFTSQPRGGIGLRNVQKRLAFLYPNSHDLSITNQGNQFSILLTLPFHEPNLQSYRTR